MAILLLFLVFLFPLGQLGRFPIAGSEVVLHLNDLLVALVVVFTIFLQGKKFLSKFRASQLFLPIIIWIFAMTTSLLVNIPNYSFAELGISALYAIRWLFYFALFFVVSSLSKEEKLLTKLCLLLSLLVVAVIGIVQFISIPDVSFLKAWQWDDHYFRLISTFFDPGFTGAIMALGLVVAFTDDTLPKKLKFVVMGIFYIALALTYSRASYLMFLVVFAAISWQKKSLKIIVAAIALLVLTFFLLPQSSGEGTKLHRENSVWARIHNWQQSFEIWSKSPVFGVGFDSYRYTQRSLGKLSKQGVIQSHSGAGSDSSILLVLATTGILGFASYLFLLGKIWTMSRKSIILSASFLGIILHSFFNNTLFYPWIMEWLWIMFAISATV